MDCRVFNPNLNGKNNVKKIIRSEFFDIIGFSFLPPTLKNDAWLIDYVAMQSPRSIIVAGGINMERYSKLLGILPFDIIILGPGELVLANILKNLPQSLSSLEKKEAIMNLIGVPNLCLYDGKNIIRTSSNQFYFVNINDNDLHSDIAYYSSGVPR